MPPSWYVTLSTSQEALKLGKPSILLGSFSVIGCKIELSLQPLPIFQRVEVELDISALQSVLSLSALGRSSLKLSKAHQEYVA